MILLGVPAEKAVDKRGNTCLPPVLYIGGNIRHYCLAMEAGVYYSHITLPTGSLVLVFLCGVETAMKPERSNGY